MREFDLKINADCIADIEAAQSSIETVIELAEFSQLCCDSDADRMYHASDKTWWR